jgi:hypothetical protein
VIVLLNSSILRRPLYRGMLHPPIELREYSDMAISIENNDVVLVKMPRIRLIFSQTYANVTDAQANIPQNIVSELKEPANRPNNLIFHRRPPKLTRETSPIPEEQDTCRQHSNGTSQISYHHSEETKSRSSTEPPDTSLVNGRKHMSESITSQEYNFYTDCRRQTVRIRMGFGNPAPKSKPKHPKSNTKENLENPRKRNSSKMDDQLKTERASKKLKSKPVSKSPQDRQRKLRQN